IYQGLEVMGDLRVRLDAAIDGTGMEILRVKNNRIIERMLGQMHDQQTLDDLSTNEVFERCLAVHQVPQRSGRHCCMPIRRYLPRSAKTIGRRNSKAPDENTANTL